MSRQSPVRVDLHSHTTASDGKLSPDELIRYAVDSEIDMLSITDHDSVEAYRQIDYSLSHSLKLIPGIEFSSQWQKVEVHILGLNIDLDNKALQAGIGLQQQHRHERAVRIANKLARLLGTVSPVDVVGNIAQHSIGRPHFAEYLVESGIVKDTREAFAKYLGTGKKAWVLPQWSEPVDIISWIRAAGGTAVLAHPGKYKLTNTKLLKLIDTFIDAGGQGLEVITGNQKASRGPDLARICHRKNLLASCGSDFHSRAQHWTRLGDFPALPAGCTPVWHDW